MKSINLLTRADMQYEVAAAVTKDNKFIYQRLKKMEDEMFMLKEELKILSKKLEMAV